MSENKCWVTQSQGSGQGNTESVVVTKRYRKCGGVGGGLWRVAQASDKLGGINRVWSGSHWQVCSKQL